MNFNTHLISGVCVMSTEINGTILSRCLNFLVRMWTFVSIWLCWRILLNQWMCFKNHVSYKNPSPYLSAGKICISVRKALIWLPMSMLGSAYELVYSMAVQMLVPAKLMEQQGYAWRQERVGSIVRCGASLFDNETAS